MSGDRWDIFCKVVDHYGDAGVCWRLATQLSAERGCSVRLWIDRLDVLQRLCPLLDPDDASQQLDGIEIRRWPTSWAAIDLPAVVVETFGCDLPAVYVEAMAAVAPPRTPPVWINLEYLSAERWVEDCHGLPSPHPRLPLTRFFFFPGFTERTGGLLIERNTSIERAGLQADAATRHEFLASLGIRCAEGELLVSLFCYAQAPMASLIETWTRSATPIRCLVPTGVGGDLLAQLHGLGNGDGIARTGALTLQRVPFLTPRDYDRLLWACDLNFVRGEDSFVRAQLAARPFVWNIYPQADHAHLVKLTAFLDRYTAGLPAPAEEALRTLHRGWNTNTQGVSAEAWHEMTTHWPAMKAHAGRWAQQLTAQGDLVAALVRFARERVESRPFKHMQA